MSQTIPEASETEAEQAESTERRLGLSLAQVAGSALAAVTAAVAASWLGVAGTIVGAAVGSVLGTVGSAVYAESLRSGGDAVRRITPSRDGRSVRIGEPTLRERLGDRLGSLPWRRVALAAAAVLMVALGAITVFENVTGVSVSRGNDSGTTVGSVLQDSTTRQDESAPHPAGSVPEPVQVTPSEPATQQPSGTPSAEETAPGQPTPSQTPSEAEPSPSETAPTEPATTESTPTTPEGTPSSTDSTQLPNAG